MTAITVEDLNNAKLDVDHIADIATSLQPNATDRMGHTKLTVKGAIDRLTFINFRGAWTTSTAYALKDAFTSGGITYVTVIPHTSTNIAADLAAGKIGLYQGVTVQTTDEFYAPSDFTPGVDDELTLSREPGSKANALVFFNNGYQGPNTWDLSGNVISFPGGIPDWVTEVFVQIGIAQSAVTPAAGSVGTDELVWGTDLIKTVDTFTDMISLPTSKYKRIRTLGYAAVGDNGHGTYAVIPGDTTTPDNGITIRAMNDGARVRLIPDGALRLEQAGAFWDGADHTTAANKVFAAAGLAQTKCRRVELSAGSQLSSGWVVPATVRLIGQGMDATTITAAPGLDSLSDLIYAEGSGVVLSGFWIDGATDGTLGAGCGIHLKGGSNCRIKDVGIEDTTQAAIYLEGLTRYKVSGVFALNNGRTGYTNNHGIMSFTTTADTVSDGDIEGCTVVNAFRKGIATYASPGSLNTLRIRNCVLSNCGLGGIYVGGVVSDTQSHIKVSGCQVLGCYAGIEAARITFIDIEGNTISVTTSSDGILLDNCGAGRVVSNTVNEASSTAINLLNTLGVNTGIMVDSNLTINANRGSLGYGAHINLSGCTNCTVTGNSCYDTGIAKATHGIYEQDGSDWNTIRANNVHNVTTGILVRRGGANSLVQSGLSGVVTELGMRSDGEKVINLINGANDNIDLPDGYGTYAITGPGTAYNITSMEAKASGAEVTLLNTTSQTLTLMNDSGSASPSANRIVCPGGTNKTVAAFGAIKLKYSTGQGAWLVIAS